MADAHGEMTTVTLLRHAECEGGEMFRGSTDVALSEQGWARLKRVTQPLADWDQVISSPLTRCRAFAEWLTEQRGLPLAIDPRFREMHHGEWEGVARDEIAARPGDQIAAWRADPETHAPPGSEPLSEVRARVGEGMVSLLDDYAGQHVLVVCHGGVMRNLMAWALDMPMAATNRLAIPYACRSQLTLARHDNQLAIRLVGHNLDDNGQYL